MNKKILITLLLLAAGSSIYSLNAQRSYDHDYSARNEVYIQYGTPTILEITTTIRNPGAEGALSGESKNHRFSGVGAFGLRRGISDIFFIGIEGGFSYASGDIHSVAKDGESQVKYYTTEVVSYTGLLSAQWMFMRNGALSISSGVYVGLNYRDETISNVKSGYDAPSTNQQYKLAYHLTALKVRYGELFGVFGELGFGYRGILNAGISLNF